MNLLDAEGAYSDNDDDPKTPPKLLKRKTALHVGKRRNISEMLESKTKKEKYLKLHHLLELSLKNMQCGKSTHKNIILLLSSLI